PNDVQPRPTLPIGPTPWMRRRAMPSTVELTIHKSRLGRVRICYRKRKAARPLISWAGGVSAVSLPHVRRLLWLCHCRSAMSEVRPMADMPTKPHGVNAGGFGRHVAYNIGVAPWFGPCGSVQG